MNFLHILLAIFIFGVLIFIHELGHFIVARLCGVKVLEFAIGMGPKLLSFRSKKSGTAYSLRLIPIGGFVSMLGESGMETVQGSSEDPDEEKKGFFLNDVDQETESDGENAESTEKNEPIDPELAKQAYCNQSVWKRILISIAGPVMNLLLGFLLMIVLVLGMGETQVGSNQVAAFFVEYTAEESYHGFLTGDCIVAVNGKETRSLDQVKEALSQDEDGIYSITVERLNESKDAIIDVTLENVPLTEEELGEWFTNSLSERSGLRINDTVIRVNRTPVHTARELTYEIASQGYRPMTLTVLRNGEKVVLENVIIPSYEESGAVFGQQDFRVYREAKFHFGTVIKHAFWQSVSTVKMVFDTFGGLFSGRFGVEAVSGPIGITQVITKAAKTGWLTVLDLVTMISINLGIMNLLPFPALDGGHLILYVVEAIRRKPVSPKVEGIINFVGLVILLGFAILISIKDVIAL